MTKIKQQEKVVQRTVYTPSEVHLREAGEGEESRTIEGYAILFNVPSLPLWEDEDCDAREVIDPSAVSQELLDQSDIKMTMFHNMQLILARSKNGEGTLSYTIDDKGVAFAFEAPHTADGDKALELVRRGDIDGCSFMFSTRYYDRSYVDVENVRDEDGKLHTTYTVKNIGGIYDFTLTPSPAYAETSCEVRELEMAAKEQIENEKRIQRESQESVDKQIAEMRNFIK